MSDYDTSALELHKKHRGKIAVVSKVPLATKDDLSRAYTPGVAAVSRAIAQDPKAAYIYTGKGNSVAVISDGSSVLGLGNIGGLASLPVMEGKAAIFKTFASIDAYPIVLASQDVDQTVATIRNIAPGFGGINLEDFKAPDCFTIEERLQDLGIPVMHDDQHGTAIVVLAALRNALRVTGKTLADARITINGVGAAGVAITKLLVRAGVPSEQIILCDSVGTIYQGREGLNGVKTELALITNKHRVAGTLADAIRDADVFIGVSKGNVLSTAMVKSMADSPIVFALANPDPEILPSEALAAGAAVVATGRSDFANQVNNALVYPGVFRGALDCHATRITDAMKLAAVDALAGLVTQPSTERILPDLTDTRVAPAIASAVAAAWIRTQ